MATIEISPVEVLALKKLVLVNHALLQTLEGRASRREQTALLTVLNDITIRADIANHLPEPKP